MANLDVLLSRALLMFDRMNETWTNGRKKETETADSDLPPYVQSLLASSYASGDMRLLSKNWSEFSKGANVRASHELEGFDKMVQYIAMRILDAQTLQAIHGIPRKDQMKFMNERGLALWPVASWRSTFEAPEKFIVSANVEPRLQKEHRILEIGSGPLDKSGYSHLMRTFPEELRASVQPSEWCNYFLNKDARLLKVDACFLSKQFSAASWDAIAAFCVLDALSMQDLNQSVDEIRKVLKPGGYFFHFSDLGQNINTMYDFYDTTDNLVIVPWVRGYQFHGFQMVAKSALRPYFTEEQEVLTTQEKEFIQHLATVPAHVWQEVVCGLMLGEKQNSVFFSAAFSHWFESKNFPGVNKVSMANFFETRLEAVLEANGFKILKMDFEQATSYLPGQVDKEQRSFLEWGQVRFLEKDTPGTLSASVRMHVLVAKVP